MADITRNMNSLQEACKQIQHQVAATKTAFKNPKKNGIELQTAWTEAVEENSNLQRRMNCFHKNLKNVLLP